MKEQLFTRLGAEAAERIIRQFNDRELRAEEAQAALGVGRSQLYRLRTQWLASGRKPDFLGVSGGDRTGAWPKTCVEHLERLILSSRDDGPNYALYADELSRKFGFVRDRSAVRRFCERNMAALLRGVFPVERKKSAPRFRRWEAESYGEVFQHDSTPRRIWGGADSRQGIIMSLDDATRRVMALRVCERECLLEHFAMLEDSFRLHGLPETLYTDGFTMFGKEGVDLCSQFGRMCRAFGICHRIAPTPQAKGKIERAMRTFQHRLVVVLRAEGADSEAAANEIAARHIAFWNANHVSEETGQIPDERAKALIGCGRSRMRPPPCDKVLRLFLSRHEPRRVELGTRIEFMGLRWRIARTLKKTVWLAIRPKNAGFYVLEERPDPTNPVVPRILAAYRF